MSSRRRARDDSDDERTPRRSSNWFKEVQSEHRASGKVLADVEAAEPKRPSVRVAPTPAAPVQATSAPSAPATTGPTKIFSGLVAVAPVPFLPSNTLRTEAYANYVASLKEDGITAVYINSAWGGESNSLTVQERTQVADWFATHAPSLRFAVNVSAPSVADSITLAKHAQSVRAAAIVVSVPVINAGSFVTLEDALDFINEVSHAVAATPLFIEHSDGTSFGITDILSAASARGLISNLRGVISRSGDMSQLSGALAIKGQLTDVIYGGEVNVVSAAFLGATSFCAREFSFIGPLYAKIVAAAQKGDVATSQQLSQLLSNFFQSVLGVVGTCDARRAAAAKVLTTLRTSSDFGSVRPPAPRLTVHEAARISDAFGAFIKTYVAQTKPTPAAAPKPIKERDGYLGKLNPAIVERIAVMESAIGVRNLVSYFPHLRVSDGSWRKSYPAENKCNPARHIDHTILKAEATRKEITTLCQEAKQNHFFAVCVNGSRVAQCLDELDGSDVKVAAVIGFPLGAGTSKAKAREARELIDMGAAEIDMVMNIGAMKDGNYRLVYEDVKAVVDAATPGIVKVIFETCLLSQTEIIDASILCVAAGAQFVKTSTGFNKAGATPDVLDVMLAVVGNESETKAAGGVRDFATAAAYVSAGVSRIGTSSGVAIISGKPAGAGY